MYSLPHNLKKEDVKWVKLHFQNLLEAERETVELGKPMVRSLFQLSSTLAMEPYLKYVTKPYHRFLLIRFRFNLIHLVLGSQSKWGSPENLPLCTCDCFSIQDTLHLVMLCEHYLVARKKFLVPILKKLNFVQVRPALLHLQMLNSVQTTYGVACFLAAAARQNKLRMAAISNNQILTLV